jgi:hypothetical protein
MSKIALEGNASGTGTFTVASPNSNSDRTLTLPDNTGTIVTSASSITASQLPAGSVIQVVTGTLGTATSTTSTTLVDVGLSASITPSSASNKVLVLVYPSVSNVDTDANAITFQVLRGATSITQAINHLFFTGFTGSTLIRRAALMLSVLDSPNTTSSTTYKLQFQSRLGNSVTTNSANDVATITLLEIKG